MGSDQTEAVTQEFHICVTPVGQDDYLVRTEQVAPGVPLVEELVTWPVTDWLTQAAQLMNDRSQTLLQGDVKEQTFALSSVNLVTLGQQLYSALFQGTLRHSWMKAQEIAQQRQEILRLRLVLKETRLARLPWELLHAVAVVEPDLGYRPDHPLATDPLIAFARYIERITPVAQDLTVSGCSDSAVELVFLGEEDWEDLVDEIDYDDPAYEEDYAVVSDLFQNLANPASSAESPIVSASTLVQLPSQRVWVVSGVVGVAAIAFGIALLLAPLGLWLQNRESQPRYLLPQKKSYLNKILTVSLPNSAEVNLKTASTSDLSAITAQAED